MRIRNHLKIIMQSTVIYSWFMAWLLITAMPVIHAHSHVLGEMHHAPVTYFSATEITQTDTQAHSHINSTYKCSLCHFTPRLFEQELRFNVTHHPFSDIPFFKPQRFHSLITLFKPARAPPFFVV